MVSVGGKEKEGRTKRNEVRVELTFPPSLLASTIRFFTFFGL